uniref:Uncharacterized protein n=1 Tax=Rhipiliopsis peltata TaxID=2320810 RepID=A0A386B1B6_9CHLO|nr:hypothetical protein [Rhipiliopsis peltata]AYC65484.1 hypothetical protein [Rhipiliopsis peltata]
MTKFSISDFFYTLLRFFQISCAFCCCYFSSNSPVYAFTIYTNPHQHFVGIHYFVEIPSKQETSTFLKKNIHIIEKFDDKKYKDIHSKELAGYLFSFVFIYIALPPFLVSCDGLTNGWIFENILKDNSMREHPPLTPAQERTRAWYSCKTWGKALDRKKAAAKKAAKVNTSEKKATKGTTFTE